MRFAHHVRRWRWTGLAALALGGCGIIAPASPIICPSVAVVSEAVDVTEFPAGGGRDVVDVRFFAEFSDVQWSCGLDGSTLEVDLTIVLSATAGPTSPAQAADLRYFVAVAERGGDLIAKAPFARRVALTADGKAASVGDEIEQRIPLKVGQSGADFEILIGLQLTREQLEYNRARGIR
jgi:hypothetical protein